MKEKKKTIFSIIAIILFLAVFCFIAKTYLYTAKTENIKLENVESIRVQKLPNKQEIYLSDSQIAECVTTLKNLKVHNEYFEFDGDELRYLFIIKYKEGKTLKVKHILDNRVMINNEVHIIDDETEKDLIAFEKTLDFTQVSDN
jgi:uncharacterized membrane protein